MNITAPTELENAIREARLDDLRAAQIRHLGAIAPEAAMEYCREKIAQLKLKQEVQK